MPTLATKKPMNVPIRMPMREGDRERDDPVHALHVDEHDEDAHRDARGDTGRQVDLAEQDDEDERHAEHDERRRLRHEVGEVALGEEERAEDREQDAEDDEAGDRGQGAHVAAAHALVPGAHLVEQAALLAAADEVGRSRCARSSVARGRRGLGTLMLCSCRGLGAGDVPDDVVAGRLLRSIEATIWPRYSTLM